MPHIPNDPPDLDLPKSKPTKKDPIPKTEAEKPEKVKWSLFPQINLFKYKPDQESIDHALGNEE